MANHNIEFSDLQDLKPIGSGSFGQVWRADYLGTDVAVKECYRSLSDMPDFDFEKYIEREVTMLKQATHPNVVQFMGTCYKDKTIYIVTEFIPGGNLKQWITHHQTASKDDVGTLSFLRTRVAFAVDIARAVAYLHARDMIHRDLKLENLLLTENQRIKVCDFGFSRLVAQTEQERKRLSFCGSDGYMAPELILCLDEYDTAVDVFSYGVILLALLSLQIPTGQGPSDVVPFRRVIPGFGLYDKEAKNCISAMPMCPRGTSFVERTTTLALSCTKVEPKQRPDSKQILSTLKEIETDVVRALNEAPISLSKTDALYVGSLNVGLLQSLQELDESNQEMSSACPSPDRPTFSTTISSSKQPTGDPGTVDNAAGSAEGLDSTSKSPMPLTEAWPHRFSVVYAPWMAKRQPKCDQCQRKMNGLLHKHLVCDDCGFVCHKKCGPIASPTCKNQPQAESATIERSVTIKGPTAA